MAIKKVVTTIVPILLIKHLVKSTYEGHAT